MAYYQIVGNNQGYVSDPGFMQNVVALGNTMGKSLNAQIFKDAAAQNSLVPETEVDSDGNTKIQYKSPQLINRGFYSAGAPGNPNGKPATPGKGAGSVAQTIKDMLAKSAVDNAAKETASYGPELGGGVGLGPGQKQMPDGSIVDQNGNQVGEGQPGMQNPQPIGPDPSSVFQAALEKQAAENPSIAKATGLPTHKTGKETLDTSISDAQSGKKTWAEVYRQYPTKIAQIQKARNASANVQDNGSSAGGTQYKAGDTKEIRGVTYVRNDQGQWLPQS